MPTFSPPLGLHGMNLTDFDMFEYDPWPVSWILKGTVVICLKLKETDSERNSQEATQFNFQTLCWDFDPVL